MEPKIGEPIPCIWMAGKGKEKLSPYSSLQIILPAKLITFTMGNDNQWFLLWILK